MAVLPLLAVVYLAFIGLGLADGAFGVAWPAMRADLAAPLEAAGAVTLLAGACSTASSVASGRVLVRLGTPRVVFVSFALTSLALAGFALAPTPGALLLVALPLGLGAGAVDAGLNHHVARHHSSRHMNWLHCAWGLGATLGPMILAARLADAGGWRRGYAVLALAQLGVTALLLVTLRRWPREAPTPARSADEGPGRPWWASAGPWLGVLAFATYTGVEGAVGLWSASLLVESRGLPPERAGAWVGLYYAAITAGRFVTGLVSERVGNRALVRAGCALAGLGGLLLLARPWSGAALAGLVLLGLGFAPVYPGLMHETARRFEPPVARSVIGLQVGAAYVGGPVLPALIGLGAARVGLELVPACVLGLILLVLAATETQNRIAPGPG